MKMQANLSRLRETYNEKNSDNIGLFLSDYAAGKNLICRKNIFGCLKKVKFENKYFYVTEYYHQHLTDYYGDYMTLPPEDEKIS